MFKFSKKTVLEKILGYKFKKRELLNQCLTHRSYSNEKSASRKFSPNNERLEFLGDSVLDLVVSELLVETFPNSSEGDLSKRLAALINEKSLAKLARQINLGSAMLLGKGEIISGGSDKDSILADTYEALIAGLYLDGGIKRAKRLIRQHFEPMLNGEQSFQDHKTTLQERVQRHFHCVPVYQLVNQLGKDHERQFQIQVLIKGKVMGQGAGKSKKEAEQQAAQAALAAIQRRD